MARTKSSASRKSSGGKALRKTLPPTNSPRATSSGSGSKGSGKNKKSKGSSGKNSICLRSTPAWQKKISLFMSKEEGNSTASVSETSNDLAEASSFQNGSTSTGELNDMHIDSTVEDTKAESEDEESTSTASGQDEMQVEPTSGTDKKDIKLMEDDVQEASASRDKKTTITPKKSSSDDDKPMEDDVQEASAGRDKKTTIPPKKSGSEDDKPMDDDDVQEASASRDKKTTISDVKLVETAPIESTGTCTKTTVVVPDESSKTEAKDEESTNTDLKENESTETDTKSDKELDTNTKGNAETGRNSNEPVKGDNVEAENGNEQNNDIKKVKDSSQMEHTVSSNNGIAEEDEGEDATKKPAKQDETIQVPLTNEETEMEVEP